MFRPSTRRQIGAGQWTRWNPEYLKLCSGTLPPPRLTRAELTDSGTSGVKVLQLEWSVDGIPNPQTNWRMCVCIYDEDSGTAIWDENQLCYIATDPNTGASTFYGGVLSLMLNAFANMSSYHNIHIYAVYLNGATGENNATPPELVAKAVSRTSYIRAAFAQPPNPAPNPTPKEGENDGDAGEHKTAGDAALLLEESRRLAAEAQRLADEAKAEEAKES
jgi:hypothetical protein